MKIIFFAALKDFFGNELILKDQSPGSVSELYAILIHTKPESVELLKKCRFAVNNSFVAEDYSLSNEVEVLVMPPSSGG